MDYLATGGTIASVPRGDGPGVSPALTAADLTGSVPGLAEVAELHVGQFLQQPSSALTLTDLLRLRDEMDARVAAGTRGLVVSQGTDSLEETAYVLDLLWRHEAPVVVTGAMRNPAQPGADGPANLLAAVRVAAGAAARGAGVVVVMADEIHAARFVRKSHTSSPAAFRSPAAGPIGWVTEGRAVLLTRPARPAHLAFTAGLSATDDLPPVALVRVGLGEDGRLLAPLADLGYRGAVIEGFGGGHVTPAMVPHLAALVRQMPVILASRTGAGEVLARTYRFCGSETELLKLGLIRAGTLDGLKARLLLTLCLAAALRHEQIAATFTGTPGPFSAA